jgi:hypothetical protein
MPLIATPTLISSPSMQLTPKPCLGCRTLVEPSGIGSYGQALVNESRMSPNEHFIAPPLCWECRGVVLLDPPDVHELVLPDGTTMRIGVGFTHGVGSRHLPIVRYLDPGH